ncbi:DNL zinc finger-domain-containing protein [Lipomyces starkeyi]
MWKLRTSGITRGVLGLRPSIVSGQIQSVVRNPAQYRQKQQPFSATDKSRNESQQNHTAGAPQAHTHTHANGEVCGDSHSNSNSHSHSHSHAHSHDASYREVARTKIAIDKPTYNITLTCKVCKNRSSHFMSHQAYHQGTVLVKCPGCNNRHLIADHLKIFSDTRITVEDIIAKDGGVIRKGTMTEYRGDITEFTEPPVLPDDTKGE